MLLNLISYIRTLHSKALYFESVDINGQINYSKRSKYALRLIFALTSILIIYKLDRGFEDDFVSYFSSVLSILVGLFITALVFSFDKFYVPKDKSEKVYSINLDQFNDEGGNLDEKNYKVAFKEVAELNAKQKLWDTQSFNYSMQFSYVTGFNIVLCIVLILLLALNTLFRSFGSIELSTYYFVREVSFSSIYIFFEGCAIFFQRFFVLYFIAIVMYKTLFIVSSMVQYNIFKMKQ